MRNKMRGRKRRRNKMRRIKARSQYDASPMFCFVSSPFPVKPQRHVTYHCSVHNFSSIGR